MEGTRRASKPSRVARRNLDGKAIVGTLGGAICQVGEYARPRVFSHLVRPHRILVRLGVGGAHGSGGRIGADGEKEARDPGEPLVRPRQGETRRGKGWQWGRFRHAHLSDIKGGGRAHVQFICLSSGFRPRAGASRAHNLACARSNTSACVSCVSKQARRVGVLETPKWQRWLWGLGTYLRSRGEMGAAPPDSVHTKPGPAIAELAHLAVGVVTY
jgi:hypothetical protein